MPLFTTLVDNFNDNIIGPNWGNAYGGVSEVGGRARVPLVAGTYAGYQTGRSWTLAGASVYFKFVTRPVASTGTDVSCNFLVTSSTDGTSIGFKYNAVTSKLRMQSNVAYFDGAALEITYDPVAHLWLRLRETGGNVLWDTSPDGTTWTNRRTLATPAWVTSSIDTTALDFYGYRDAGTTDYGEFDNVNTLSDGAVYTASAALTADGALAATSTYAAAVSADLTTDSGLTAATVLSARAAASLSVDFDLSADTNGREQSDVTVTVGEPASRWVVNGPWR